MGCVNPVSHTKSNLLPVPENTVPSAPFAQFIAFSQNMPTVNTGEHEKKKKMVA